MALAAQSALQKKAVEAILAKVRLFMDARYAQVRRVNPRVESVWEDLLWQVLGRLRNSLSGDKAFGPVRFHVSETLLADDQKKIRDLFSFKAQQSLLGEIVDMKEGEGHRTAGSTEIHDMRSLFRAIDPSLESVATLIQTFIWWDLEDAALLAKFDKKAGLIPSYEQNGLTPEMATMYMELIGGTKRPDAAAVVQYELTQLRAVVDIYRQRREEEHTYQAIIAREATAQENPEMLIEALAQQQQMLRSLRAGGTIDEVRAEQFAKAMGIEPAMVTPERVSAFLETMIAGNRTRLRGALNGGGSGPAYNLKAKKLEELEQRLAELMADRQLTEAPPTA